MISIVKSYVILHFRLISFWNWLSYLSESQSASPAAFQCLQTNYNYLPLNGSLKLFSTQIVQVLNFVDALYVFLELLGLRPYMI